jgi:hypothetical protein
VSSGRRLCRRDRTKGGKDAGKHTEHRDAETQGGHRSILSDNVLRVFASRAVARLSLFENEAGLCLIRMRGLLVGGDIRPVFAMAMDMWHDDLDLIRRRPASPLEGAEDETEETVTVAVN